MAGILKGMFIVPDLVAPTVAQLQQNYVNEKPCRPWSQNDWTQALQSLQVAGVTTIIPQFSAQYWAKSNSTDSRNLTFFYPIIGFPSTNTYDNTSFKDVSEPYQKNQFKYLFEAVKQLNANSSQNNQMTVYLPLQLAEDEWFSTMSKMGDSNTATDFCGRHLPFSQWLATDLATWVKNNGYASFVEGWYLPFELNNTDLYGQNAIQNLVSNYYLPLLDDKTQGLRQQFPSQTIYTLMSPLVYTKMQDPKNEYLQNWNGMWAYFLKNTTINYIAPQDGCGAENALPSNLAPWYAALGNAMDKITGRTLELWNNQEIYNLNGTSTMTVSRFDSNRTDLKTAMANLQNGLASNDIRKTSRTITQTISFSAHSILPLSQRVGTYTWNELYYEAYWYYLTNNGTRHINQNVPTPQNLQATSTARANPNDVTLSNQIFSVDLTFNRVTFYETMPGIVGYVIKRAEVVSGTIGTAMKIAEIPQTPPQLIVTYRDDQIVTGKTYQYYVYAFDASGNMSAPASLSPYYTAFLHPIDGKRSYKLHTWTSTEQATISFSSTQAGVFTTNPNYPISNICNTNVVNGFGYGNGPSIGPNPTIDWTSWAGVNQVQNSSNLSWSLTVKMDQSANPVRYLVTHWLRFYSDGVVPPVSVQCTLKDRNGVQIGQSFSPVASNLTGSTDGVYPCLFDFGGPQQIGSLILRVTSNNNLNWWTMFDSLCLYEDVTAATTTNVLKGLPVRLSGASATNPASFPALSGAEYDINDIRTGGISTTHITQLTDGVAGNTNWGANSSQWVGFHKLASVSTDGTDGRSLKLSMVGTFDTPQFISSLDSTWLKQSSSGIFLPNTITYKALDELGTIITLGSYTFPSTGQNDGVVNHAPVSGFSPVWCTTVWMEVLPYDNTFVYMDEWTATAQTVFDNQLQITDEAYLYVPDSTGLNRNFSTTDTTNFSTYRGFTYDSGTAKLYAPYLTSGLPFVDLNGGPSVDWWDDKTQQIWMGNNGQTTTLSTSTTQETVEIVLPGSTNPFAYTPSETFYYIQFDFKNSKTMRGTSMTWIQDKWSSIFAPLKIEFDVLDTSGTWQTYGYANRPGIRQYDFTSSYDWSTNSIQPQSFCYQAVNPAFNNTQLKAIRAKVYPNTAWTFANEWRIV